MSSNPDPVQAIKDASGGLEASLETLGNLIFGGKKTMDTLARYNNGRLSLEQLIREAPFEEGEKRSLIGRLPAEASAEDEAKERFEALVELQTEVSKKLLALLPDVATKASTFDRVVAVWKDIRQEVEALKDAELSAATLKQYGDLSNSARRELAGLKEDYTANRLEGDAETFNRENVRRLLADRKVKNTNPPTGQQGSAGKDTPAERLMAGAFVALAAVAIIALLISIFRGGSDSNQVAAKTKDDSPEATVTYEFSKETQELLDTQPEFFKSLNGIKGVSAEDK